MQTLPESPSQRRFNRRGIEKMVRKWNVQHRPGTPVKYWPTSGPHPCEPIETLTQSEAEVGASGQPVVLLQGISGHVSLFHVLPLAHEPAAA